MRNRTKKLDIFPRNIAKAISFELSKNQGKLEMNKYNTKKSNSNGLPQRRSIRLKGYDYSQAGLYFVTICCQDRICRFGKVVNGEMALNEYGQIAYNEWLKTPDIRKNVELDEFVIMPNHIHGIIRLMDRGGLHSPGLHSPGLHSPELHSPEISGVRGTPLRSPSQTVGAIIRGYKSSVTKQLGLLDFGEKLWQRNYHDHIIRDEQSHIRISEYIINNPAKWTDDKFYRK